jgi:hypothetical protein
VSRQHYADVAFAINSGTGVVYRVASPQITVYEPGTTTPIAQTLYAADSGGTTRANPFPGNPNGTFDFFLNSPQLVKLSISGTGPDGPVTLTADYVPVGTVGAPTARSISATEQRLTIGGVSDGSQDVIRMRMSNHGPAVGIGMIKDIGGTDQWAWTSPDVILKIHHVETSTSSGTVVGAQAEIKSFAKLEDGAFPDHAAASFIAYMPVGSHGSSRALEAQQFDESIGTHPNSTVCTCEFGWHGSRVGNGTSMTGVINLLAVGTGVAGTPVACDFGIYGHGSTGAQQWWRFFDETATALGLLSYLNKSGELRTRKLAVGNDVPSGQTFHVTGATNQMLSGGATTDLSYTLGRTAPDLTLGIAGSAGHFSTLAAAGDAVLRAESGKKLYLNANALDVVTVAESGGAGLLGFFGGTPVAKRSAYTQTYATASRTHANPNAATLTNANGTGSSTIADVTGAHSQTILNNNFRSLSDQINGLVADMANVKQIANSLIYDAQAFSLTA